MIAGLHVHLPDRDFVQSLTQMCRTAAAVCTSQKWRSFYSEDVC